MSGISSGQTDEDGMALNDVEKSLSKVGIALRLDETHFRNFGDVIDDVAKRFSNWNDIQRNEVMTALAGVRQKENLAALLQNYGKSLDYERVSLESNGKSWERYQEYLKSTESQYNKLKAAQEKMFMDFLQSETINSVVQGLTRLVETLDYLGTNSLKSSIKVIALSTSLLLLLKHSKGVIGTFGNITTFLGMMGDVFKRTSTMSDVLGASFVGLTSVWNKLKATMTTLFLTPQGIAFLALVYAVGLATVSLTQHIKKQKEIAEQVDKTTKSYKNLTEAMKENNVEEIKSNSSNLSGEQTKLQGLLKQKEDLIKQLNNTNPDEIEIDPTGLTQTSINKYGELSSQLESVNTKIEEQKKILKDSGLTIDETTGKIKQLDQAEEQLKQNALRDKIIQERDAIVKQKEDLIGLIQEYQNLANAENKNAIQKERMTQLSNQLNGEIKGLVLARDEEGNTIIKNAGLLDAQISMLTTEAETAKTNANVKLTNAKNSATAQIGETKVTYEEISKRIKMYQAEMDALEALQKTASETLKASSSEDNWQLNASRVATINRMLTTSKSANEELQKAKDLIDKIYDGGSNVPSPSTSSNSSYIPPIKDSSSTKENTRYTSDIKSEQTYSSIIQEQNDKLKLQDNLLDSISAKISEKEKAEETTEVIKYQNQLLDEQKNKLDLLSDSKSKYNATLDTIKQDFYTRFGTDISTLSQAQLNEIYDKMFAGERDFGTGEAGQKAKEIFQDNADTFKSWIKDWFDIKSAIVDTDKAVQGLNASIMDTQIDMKDRVKNTLKAYYEASKDSDEITMKARQDAEKESLEKTIYNITEADWNKYRNNRIERIKKALKELEDRQKLDPKDATLNDAVVARQTELQLVTDKTYSSISDWKTAYEEFNQERIKQIDTEIEAMERANEVQQEQEERIKRINELTKLQSELEKIRSNKNVRILKKQGDGYQYDYTYDQEEYEKKNKELTDAQLDYSKWELENQKQRNKQKLLDEKAAIEEMLKMKSDLGTEELEALDKKHEAEKIKLDNHYKDIDTLVALSMDNLKQTYGDKWDEILAVIDGKLTIAKAKLTELQTAQNNAKNIQVSDSPIAPVITADNVKIEVNNNGDSQLDYIKANYSSGMVDAYLRLTGKKYATGGLNDSTGWHWLDGTPSKPELNANDTKNLLNAVKLNSKFASVIPSLLEKFRIPDFGKFALRNDSQSSEIHYHVDAILPNVTNESGVANFFEGITLQARQKAVPV